MRLASMALGVIDELIFLFFSIFFPSEGLERVVMECLCERVIEGFTEGLARGRWIDEGGEGFMVIGGDEVEEDIFSVGGGPDNE
ncbi:hypothetical protein Syun_019647 [Stephania yunnanensis]|uniref:Uncharacterized protein n=1 Tax=Stephania yunnanensis TaxID=152371 RepID=A0AAP0IV82_9MAGN